MSRVDLILSMRFEEPLGASEKEVAKRSESIYSPLLKLLENNKAIKIALYFNGILHDWFQRSDPDFVQRLKELVKRGQVELLTGAYYSPRLDLIPDRDKIDQIRLQTEIISRTFSYKPRGMMIPSDQFEPRLINVLSQLDIDHALVRSDALAVPNAVAEDLHGYYVAEDHGHTLKVFPLRDESSALASATSAYEIKWSENSVSALFKKINESADAIKTLSFSDYLEDAEPSGVAHLKTEQNGKLLVISDPSLNNLHKKALHVSAKLDSLRRAETIGGESDSRVKAISEAENKLWIGEGDVLTAGDERAAVGVCYENLIGSENAIDGFIRSGQPYIDLSVTDFDKDGTNEALISTGLFNVYISPKRGGSIFELDYRLKKANILNLSGVLREPALLCDRFIDGDDPDSFAETLKNKRPSDLGAAFKMTVNKNSAEVQIKLSQDRKLTLRGEEVDLRFTKTISVFSGQSIIRVYYEIENRTDKDISFRFGPEFDFALDADLDERKILETSKIKLIDSKRGFSVTLGVEDLSEILSIKLGDPSGGYAGTVLIPNWSVSLAAATAWSGKLSMSFDE
jgi:hypothetical protein